MPNHPPSESQDTKLRIVAAAAALVSKHGFNGIGLGDILKEAGVPKGSFYHWFASKEQLGVELLRSVGKAVLDEQRALLSRSDMMPDAIDRLSATMEAGLLELLKKQDTPAGMMLKLGGEISSTSEAMRLEVAAFFQAAIELYSGVISEGQAAGQIRKDVPAGELAAVVCDVWAGAYMRALVVRTAQALRSAVSHLRGYLTP
jgi:TetR/AcrR family transcriptional repressor of nem operon